MIAASVFCLASTLFFATTGWSVAQSFSNPILSPPAADPSVALVDGMYYAVRSGCPHDDGRTPAICIQSAPNLPALADAPAKAVWVAPAEGPNAKEIWAPEIEYLDHHWYIY